MLTQKIDREKLKELKETTNDIARVLDGIRSAVAGTPEAARDAALAAQEQANRV